MTMTRSDVMKKAWITRRANEERAANSVSADIERIPGRSRVFPSNPRIDQAIAEAYRQWREFGNRKAIGNLAKKIGWPRYRVNRRAREMGIAQTKEAPWSEAEVAILQRWGHKTDAGIQKKLAKAGFHRSLTAIHLKVKRLKIKQNLDGYSATSLSDAFGIDNHRVTGWIKRGMLKAERRGTLRNDANHWDTWWITNAAVKEFVSIYPAEIDLAKVEKFWFLDLVTNGVIAERNIELGKLRSQVNALVEAARETAKIRARERKSAETEITRLQAQVERLSMALHLPPDSATAEAIEATVSALLGLAENGGSGSDRQGRAAMAASAIDSCPSARSVS